MFCVPVVCFVLDFGVFLFYLSGWSGADLTFSKTRNNNHQTELFVTILIVRGNASVGGTVLVDVASAVSGAYLFLDSLAILHCFPMTSVESLKVPLSLCPFVPLFSYFRFLFWNTLTCRSEKNLNWFTSGSRADQRGGVFRVAIAMSVYEMTEWLGFSPLCETPRLPQSYK